MQTVDNFIAIMATVVTCPIDSQTATYNEANKMVGYLSTIATFDPTNKWKGVAKPSVKAK